MFGRVCRLPDGTPKIFHDSLDWNVQSKLKSYSLGNLHYKSRQLKNKPRRHSESKPTKSIKGTSRHQLVTETISLPIMSDDQLQSDSEIKVNCGCTTLEGLNFNSRQSFL